MKCRRFIPIAPSVCIVPVVLKIEEPHGAYRLTSENIKAQGHVMGGIEEDLLGVNEIELCHDACTVAYISILKVDCDGDVANCISQTIL